MASEVLHCGGVTNTNAKGRGAGTVGISGGQTTIGGYGPWPQRPFTLQVSNLATTLIIPISACYSLTLRSAITI